MEDNSIFKIALAMSILGLVGMVFSADMITAREIVIRLTPARKAPAPTMAKMPGEMVWAKNGSWPTSRPKKAPPSSAGMMIPEGTLIPKVIMVRTSFTRVPYANQPKYFGEGEPSPSRTQT